MLTVSPIDPHMTNEGLFRSNEDERVGLNEVEHMRHDHDELSMDEAEFRTAESYVWNKEDNSVVYQPSDKRILANLANQR